MNPLGHGVWQRSPALAVIESEDRVAVVDLDRPGAPPRILEGSAAMVWAAIDGTRTTAQVVDEVTGSHAGPAAALEAGVLSFLSDLADAGLIRERA